MHFRPHCGLLFLSILCLCAGVFALPQEKEDINYELVRCNPVLRQALSANSPYAGTTNEESVEYKFRENWVDGQVDHFVKQTYRTLSELKESVKQASSASLELNGDDSGKRAQAIATLRQALVKAEDQSKHLRSSLAMVLVELATKDKFQIKVGREAQKAGFKLEIESLSEQTANAERYIRDYFFQPTHVTSITDLKEANMLDYLKRVERIARAIRERL